jgi:hypothetical protein
MRQSGILLATALLLGSTAGWAQTSGSALASPPSAGTSSPALAPLPSDADTPPGGVTPDTTTPRSQEPDTPGAPNDRAVPVSPIAGLRPASAVVIGLVLLAVIIALTTVGSRRHRDVAVDRPTDTPVGDPTLRGYADGLERERHRRAS